ncbi:MAG: prolipoprotein diacylglyceryl transferase [Actinomycetota bacterium]|nr:prolipoprotein diacylglyceryl transferase [Actinomycetota bacterium]
MGAFLAYIPSPPVKGVSIGPIRLHFYGLMIALGVIVAVWMAQRQWTRIGGRSGAFSSLAVWAVPAGLVGARVYSLCTSWNVDTQGHWWKAFAVWDGGLGIWGGVLVGVAGGLYAAHRLRLPWAPLMDCVAPALPLAQAIGRIGNYFNQELYGWRTNLPWGVKIDHALIGTTTASHYAPPGVYQPTFLYEMIGDVLVAVLVVWAMRRFRIRRGYAFAIYSGGYTFVRFWTEYMRIDPAHIYLGLRLNDWTCILVFTCSVLALLIRGRAPAGDDVAGAPLDVHPSRYGPATGAAAPAHAGSSAGSPSGSATATPDLAG